jgi:hypothetical protein
MEKRERETKKDRHGDAEKKVRRERQRGKDRRRAITARTLKHSKTFEFAGPELRTRYHISSAFHSDYQ